MRIEFLIQKDGRARSKSQRFFFQLSDAVTTYAYGIRQIMYTPNDISVKDPPQGEYPYSGSILVHHSVTSSSVSNGLSLQTEYVIGCLGPVSLAAETQTKFHILIGDNVPKGWSNQFANMLITNVNVSLEKRLISYFGIAELIVRTELSLGTMFNGVRIEPQIRIGRFTQYFQSLLSQYAPRRTDFICYLTLKPSIQYAAHDALLSGSLYPRKDDERPGIKSGPISHARFYTDVSVFTGFNGIGLSLSYKTHSGLVKQQNTKAYGGITLSFLL